MPEEPGLDDCRACGSRAEWFADAPVLVDVPVTWLRCPRCGMVMARDPRWLEEAYSAPITRLDIGLLDRCLLLSNITAAVIRSERISGGRFLDWAGGYGTLTRLMRDRGLDFTHHDPMTANVFAVGHEEIGAEESAYDLVTGFEVLEHLVDPVSDLAATARRTDRLLLTTQVLPQPTPAPGQWWYYTLETGQHITLFTREGIAALAARLGFDHVVSGSFLHLMHRGPVSALTRRLVSRPALAYGAGWLTAPSDRRRSLLATDLAAARWS